MWHRVDGGEKTSHDPPDAQHETALPMAGKQTAGEGEGGGDRAAGECTRCCECACEGCVRVRGGWGTGRRRADSRRAKKRAMQRTKKAAQQNRKWDENNAESRMHTINMHGLNYYSVL